MITCHKFKSSFIAVDDKGNRVLWNADSEEQAIEWHKEYFR